MVWSNLHASLIAKAFERVLGAADLGAMAFVRCLTPDVILALASDATFAPGDWQV